MPSFTHTLLVSAAPERVYAIIDDTDRTPEWLSRCTRIDNPANGHNTVGTPLTYHYKDGRRTGEMDGRITRHEVGRRFTMNFVDKMMDVTVDFDTAPGADAATTTLTHSIDIKTKGFGKLFTPIIKKTLPKQTTGAMEKLKALAERGQI
jgi:ribosome-associated toxin RatA of RatAB toxin-antitoxin module